MPVNTVHPKYAKRRNAWKLCRTFREGEEAVKAEGETFLPSLTGQDDDEYYAYKMRAMFYSAMDRTVKGLTGMIMRKTAQIEAPDPLLEVMKHIGSKGESFTQVTAQVVEEEVGMGRVGLFLDAAANYAEEPTICQYYAENIVSWVEALVNGKMQPIRVVLKEEKEVQDPDDPFNIKTREQYRVLRLGNPRAFPRVLEKVEGDLATISDETLFFYWVETWVRLEKKKNSSDGLTKPEEEFAMESAVIPKMKGGRTLNYIPFKPINPHDQSMEPDKAPCEDLAHVNASHYRTSADLEHGRHFTALPTPYFTGKIKRGSVLSIGSGVAWNLEMSATAGMIEFSGAGLGNLQTALEHKERLMAVLGARLLEDQKPGVEAEGTVQLRHSGEQSVLANISDSCSEGLTTVLRWAAEWMGLAIDPETITVRLNKDFNLVGIDSGTMLAMLQALQSGGMSYKTYFFNLQRGEVYPEGMTEAEEADLIAAGPPGQTGEVTIDTPPPEGAPPTQETATPPDKAAA